MRLVLIIVVCVGMLNSGCVPVLGLAAAGAGAGAQAGWWFGKSSKPAADEKASDAKNKKEETHGHAGTR